MTTPQPQLNNRRIPVPRGHVVGGSGSINGMVYFRGQPRDFDDWAAAGNPGWSYPEVMPYFLRSENNEAFPSSPYHAQGGPMNVKFVAQPNPMSPAFLKAMELQGYRANSDFNGPDPEGFGPRQGTILDGRRVSTATAYLETARKRGNLSLLTGTRVARVLIENNRATGVEVLPDGEPGSGANGKRKIVARREVVLWRRCSVSAGVDALGHRRWRRAAQARHRGEAPSARRRSELSGSSRCGA